VSNFDFQTGKLQRADVSPLSSFKGGKDTAFNAQYLFQKQLFTTVTPLKLPEDAICKKRSSIEVKFRRKATWNL